MTVALDVLQEPSETLLPLVGPRLQGPAGQVLKTELALGLKGPFGEVIPLRISPRTERVAVDRVGLRDAGMTVALDVLQEPSETLLPPVGPRVPVPAGQVLKTVLTVGFKGGAPHALIADPLTELVVVGRVGVRHAGVTVAFDVKQESLESLLPLVGLAIPGPAGQLFEAASAIGVKGARGVVDALPYDPSTELVAVDCIGSQHA